MDLCFFLFDGVGAGGVLLFLALLFLVFCVTHFRTVILWGVIIGVIVLCVCYDLFFWISLIGLILLAWGYGIYYLKKLIKWYLKKVN